MADRSPSAKNGRGGERPLNVQVAVRCRPPNAKERLEPHFNIVQCDENAGQVTTPGTCGVVRKAAAATGEKTYNFDYVFGPTSTQKQVYDTVCSRAVDEVLEGFNCTIFAYGPTGTGKTHTMEGGKDEKNSNHSDDRHAGLIPRSVKQIFTRLRRSNQENSVRVSHLELYNEHITDLLSVSDEAEKLRIYDDEKTGTFVLGLAETTVEDESQVFQILQRSAKKRITAETEMNKYSSRSHSIFTITVHSKSTSSDGDELLRVGKLNLVDLAGSENIGRSGAVSQRAREAGNINQSLLALGKVINALVEHQPYVPYRDSKLTRLLQESLGGKNKTCIVATIGPAFSSLEETISTLEYAFRAKSIKNRPTMNSMVTKKELLADYTRRMARLEKELLCAREKNGVYLPLEEYNTMKSTMQEMEVTIGIQEQSLLDKEDIVSKLEKELNETFAELRDTRSLLKSAEKELNHTRNVLTTTSNNLNHTQNQLEEVSHLLQCHRSTEDRLHVQALDLTRTLSTTLEHLEALHTKVDAMESDQEINGRVLGEFIEKLHSSMLGWDENMQELVNRQEENLSKLDLAGRTALENVNAYTDQVVSSVGMIEEDVVSTSRSVLEHSSTVLDQVQTASEKQKAAVDEVWLGLKARLVEIRASQQSLQGAMAQFSEHTADSMGKYSQTQIMRSEENKKLMSSMTSSNRVALTEISNNLSNLVSSHSDKTAELVLKNRAFADSMSRNLKSCETEVIESIVSILSSFVLSVADGGEKELAKAREDIKMAKDSGLEMITRFGKLAASVKTEVQEASTRKDELDKDLAGLSLIMMDEVQKNTEISKETVEAARKDNKLCSAAIISAVKGSEKEVASLVEFEGKTAEVFEASYKDLMDRLGSQREAASESTNKVLTAMREDISSVLNEVKVKVVEVGKRSEKIDTCVVSACSELSDRVNAFSNSYKIDMAREEVRERINMTAFASVPPSRTDEQILELPLTS